jgi:hypothetical protein
MASNPYNLGSFRVNMNDLRDNIFDALSLTSQFKVSLFLSTSSQNSGDLISHLRRCKLLEKNDILRYDFLCSEAVLPGSTFDMAEEYGSRQGIIERFPTRRVYSDFNLTFYVDANYKLIRLFEEWMNFIDPLHTERITYNGNPGGQSERNYMDSNSFFRFKYPNLYKKTIGITKFERNFSDSKGKSQDVSSLTYQFIDAFPTNLTALPLSYEGSTITKTTVNFSYARYIVMKHDGKALNEERNFVNNITSTSALSEIETPLTAYTSRSDTSQDSNPVSGGQGQPTDPTVDLSSIPF